ncbi:MAG: peptidoglycan recognition family protein, partial [Evtepia sp.]|uniref:peptidoglycan recognition protein family protein n=1 Tax=Evtepia sp. TaxID=2773933 RepID=UPI002A7627C7
MTPRGIMVHSTGANNPNLWRYVQPDDGLIGVNRHGNSFNEFHPGGRQVCAHAFIGRKKDGGIATYQIMPWNWEAWHSGKGRHGSAWRMGYIGFEICEDGLTDRDYFKAVYREAVELCAYLCGMFGLDPVKDIICHSEGYVKGIASAHADVMHWFPQHGKSMDIFRADVQKEMCKRKEPDMDELKVRQIVDDELLKGTVVYETLQEVPAWGRETVKKLVDK